MEHTADEMEEKDVQETGMRVRREGVLYQPFKEARGATLDATGFMSHALGRCEQTSAEVHS